MLRMPGFELSATGAGATGGSGGGGRDGAAGAAAATCWRTGPIAAASTAPVRLAITMNSQPPTERADEVGGVRAADEDGDEDRDAEGEADLTGHGKTGRARGEAGPGAATRPPRSRATESSRPTRVRSCSSTCGSISSAYDGVAPRMPEPPRCRRRRTG